MTLDERRRRYATLTKAQRSALDEMARTRLLTRGCNLGVAFRVGDGNCTAFCPIIGSNGDCNSLNRQERYDLWLLLSKREQPPLFDEDDVVIPSRIEE